MQRDVPAGVFGKVEVVVVPRPTVRTFFVIRGGADGWGVPCRRVECIRGGAQRSCKLLTPLHANRRQFVDPILLVIYTDVGVVPDFGKEFIAPCVSFGHLRTLLPEPGPPRAGLAGYDISPTLRPRNKKLTQRVLNLDTPRGHRDADVRHTAVHGDEDDDGNTRRACRPQARCPANRAWDRASQGYPEHRRRTRNFAPSWASSSPTSDSRVHEGRAPSPGPRRLHLTAGRYRVGW